jgi:hypothetical protein
MTLFTLYVIPVVLALLARKQACPQQAGNLILAFVSACPVE